MSRTFVIIITAGLAVAGCGNKKDSGGDNKPAPGSAAPTPTPGSAAPTPGSAAATGSAGSGSAGGGSAGSAAPVAAGPVEVPTEVDFEAQAKTDITAATVDSKVKALEDQLGQ